MVHGGLYTCPYCAETMDLDEATISDHLKEHRGMHFDEFQCVHCDQGFNEIDEIRNHMAEYHASQFLFVGARRTSNPCNADTDDIQFVYIGDNADYSQYTFSKCSDKSALNKMEPSELRSAKIMERLQILKMEFPQLKIPFHNEIPPIEYSCQKTDFFINYDQYQKLPIRRNKKPKTIEYKCITQRLVDELSPIRQHLEPFIRKKPCSGEGMRNVREMIRHHSKRHAERHAEQSIVFLQIERSECFVYKMVQCKFQCQLCTTRFDTRVNLNTHFCGAHPNFYVGGQIVLEIEVIESNDRDQPIQSRTESTAAFVCSAFICDQHKNTIGTRKNAIDHFNAEHIATGGFEFRMSSCYIDSTPENIQDYENNMNNPLRMHLIQCQHCLKLFESVADIQTHFKNDGIVEPQFTIKKLFACPHDKVVGIYASMKHHFRREHPNKPCTPVNAFFSTICGFCSYRFDDFDDLKNHYERIHSKGEIMSNKLLQSMDLNHIDMAQCHFGAGCCHEVQRKPLLEIVRHVMNCSRRFTCIKCPDYPNFSSILDFVPHCNAKHSMNETQINNILYDLKSFMLLLSDMSIVLPNGLAVTMDEMSNTTFGDQLRVQANEILDKLREEEQRNILPLTLLY